MEQKETKHTQDWGFLKFDPIILVRDVAKRWLLILLVVLMVHMTLHGMALFPTYASFTLAAISMLIAPKKEGEPCPS